ncbi:SDR family oxidoreductase [Rhodovarius crocodyli]|uniref:SDR family oxidoreductase n=1 Tax=Rhodovarius crocodyli TaxID=1979269 RepID=A0A437MLQ8_9PROT|nr:SDR family oxidoreductase [Rhodovarius crocodyli]RVT98563.1 SDR family oxidoreductase [Rhodovarius crocodyli]
MILILGATGLIGTHVAARLARAGHPVLGVARDIDGARRRSPGMAWARADLRHTTAEEWAGLLDGVHAVVNCAGALQDAPGDSLSAVHADGLRHLVQACEARGVRRFVHLSAAGVAVGRETAFNATKLAGEMMLERSALDWVILRPGLVLAPTAYGGSALLRGVAGFPGCIPLAWPDATVQAISVEDVAEAVLRALDGPARLRLDLVHAEPWPLRRLLPELRRWLGLRPARVIPLPAPLAWAAGRVADGLAWLGWRSPMRSTALEQLRQGIEGKPADAQRALGRQPLSVPAMLAGWPAGVQERWFARLYFLKPAMLGVLAGFWLISGIIGLLNVEGAATVLDEWPEEAAWWAVVGGSVVDIALGLAVMWRRAAGWALAGMLVVSAGYLLGGTLLRGDLWLDPLGPFLKIIPAAFLALAALAVLDDR